MVYFTENFKQSIIFKLRILYGGQAEQIFDELEDIIDDFKKKIDLKNRKKVLNHDTGKKYTYKDLVLNLYADSINGSYGTPLQVLKRFSQRYFKELLRGIHVLPFYPWDTDRGFSVLNYYQVDSRNGSWEDFSVLKRVFDNIMVDCVVNHASLDNPIVQKALLGDPEYDNFVISFTEEERPSDEEIQKITRARPSPVLTEYFVVENGERKRWVTFDKPTDEIKSIKLKIIKKGWCWTTFSRPLNPDGTVATKQVDLNYANPKVFLEFLKIMLFYISKGITWFRLDAIGYLWKQIGTPCLHLPEAHIIIQLWDEIFSYYIPFPIVLIAEVNEPQENALNYLGNSQTKEADMIYLFTHFPLAVHAVLTGNANYYMNWLPSLERANGKLFISVLGTHDGMGMKPIGDWLPEVEKIRLQRILIEKHGALANYARIPGGKKIVYELCATPWNFINEPDTNETLSLQISRYLVVLALGLMIRGVPSIYINGLLGIPNFDGILDENRSINRQILNDNELIAQLEDKTSLMYSVYMRIKHLLRLRAQEKAFELGGEFKPLLLSEKTVSILLSSIDNKNRILALVNVSSTNQLIEIPIPQLGFTEKLKLIDIIDNTEYDIELDHDIIEFNLNPYQISWLKIN